MIPMLLFGRHRAAFTKSNMPTKQSTRYEIKYFEALHKKMKEFR
jgi:hypothetical protein